jgi:hypothetical protein
MRVVIDIEEMRLTRDQRLFRPAPECQHLHITLDDKGEIIKCDDCGVQLTAWWTMNHFLEQYRKAREKILAREERQIELEKKTVVLKAALKVEEAWRRHKMVPICPHCHHSIYPADGFGEAMVRKPVADTRGTAIKVVK